MLSYCIQIHNFRFSALPDRCPFRPTERLSHYRQLFSQKSAFCPFVCPVGRRPARAGRRAAPSGLFLLRQKISLRFVIICYVGRTLFAFEITILGISSIVFVLICRPNADWNWVPFFIYLFLYLSCR